MRPLLLRESRRRQIDGVIDGTVFEMAKLYFIWSGWPEATDGAQNLYIAPMSNPWKINGERLCLSQPDHDW